MNPLRMLDMSSLELMRHFGEWETSLMNVKNPWFIIAAESYGRQFLMHKYMSEKPDFNPIEVPENLERRVAGIDFRSPLLNAAGMFKSVNQNVYNRAFMQGAGGVIFGTFTPSPRKGNVVKGIRWPFLRLPKSSIAINYMGLPNDGVVVNAERLESIAKKEKFPVGVSVAGDPDENDFYNKMGRLSASMSLFERAGADFIEVNLSCPNTKKSQRDNSLERQAEFLSNEYINKNWGRKIPVFAKFSPEVTPNEIYNIVDILSHNGFAGAVFGNTTINYDSVRHSINDDREKELFNAYLNLTGNRGGVSGFVLHHGSGSKSARAVVYGEEIKREDFEIIRCGGINMSRDVKVSLTFENSLCEWFSGYWHNFTKHGDNVYRSIYENLN